MDDLFSLDNVRDFMLSKGGKVKNHDLVTHFKTFLNDPTRKASNRQQFKTFVNTLATVKLDESGEKILVLKKKYRDSAATDNRPQDKPRHEVHHDFSTPMPKAPPRKIHKGAALWEDSAVGEAAADASVGMEGAMSDVNALYEAAAAATVDDTNLEPTSTAAVTVTGLPTNESSSDLGTLVITGVPESESSTDATDHIHISGIPTSESCTEPEGFVQLQGMHGNESTTDPVDAAPSEPERVEIRITDSLPSTTPSDTSSERDSPFVSETVSLASEASSMKGESCLTSETSSIRETSPDAQPPVTYPASYSTMSPEEDDKIPNATPMSVKDRAKHLNKIVSESDIHSNKAKENKTDRGDRKGDDDSSSVSSVPISMDAAEREWLVLSSMADYHPMAKVLLQSPHLAKRKNFMNGFNPLHWAAKHGKPEVIKLLCGTHCVDVNARSHGGYTALHLAAMHGHEEIIELLVHGYGADPNIRDYSGKKAKQYLPTYASTRAHLLLLSEAFRLKQQELLQARRLSAAPGGGNFRRVGSYSAKIQKSGFFGLGNRASVAMRDSWASNTSDASDGMLSPSPAASPKASPKSSPFPSPSIGRKGSTSKENESMPPPKVPPPRRKKSRKTKDIELVTDDMFRERAGSDPTQMSPTSAKSQFI